MSSSGSAPAPTPLPATATELPETFGYKVKRLLLGPPLVTERLRDERLSNPVALGVLAPDCISSSAYGTEEMLIELLPYAGLAAFTLVLPITLVILFILLLLTMSYREVVQVYTRAGGSYVVARENFGPNVAQIAAVALLIDYTLTVAVQTAAGTVAVASAVPALGPYSLEISIAVVLLLCYGNLRGIREAGRSFAFPLYFFAVSMLAVIVVGVLREVFGHLPAYNLHHLHGLVAVGQGKGGLVLGASLLVLARSFANGGSSLTGLEAISNSVSAFRRPEGRNARRVLVVMSLLLGTLVMGVSWLAHVTHAAPYQSGYPSVISQEARMVFGSGVLGHVLFDVVQTATALILYTGGNTSFNGFPFLASFVAEDSFLPRQLNVRGHRLVFSNGIVVLTVVSLVLLIATRARVNALIPLYAIGVFTGFTMAGLGMARYHTRTREAAWRRRFVINLTGGLVSALVVLIFAVVKFGQGAWVVVVLFPVLVFGLIRLNRRYRQEAAVLHTFGGALGVAPNFARHTVLVFVDTLDLATLQAIRYARSLKPTEVRAVHFVLDSRRARQLEGRWARVNTGGVGLELLDCPDRRLARAALELIARTVADGTTEVTVLLPRRTYSPLLGRLLHDRTADRIAAVVARVPHAAATIVPFDPSLPPSPPVTERRTTLAEELGMAGPGDRPVRRPRTGPHPVEVPGLSREQPTGPAEGTPIGQLRWRQRARVEGQVRSVQQRTLSGSPVLECVIMDGSGGVRVLFYGRDHIEGVRPGGRIRVEGMVGSYGGHLAIMNPSYQLLPAPE